MNNRVYFYAMGINNKFYDLIFILLKHKSQTLRNVYLSIPSVRTKCQQK